MTIKYILKLKHIGLLVAVMFSIEALGQTECHCDFKFNMELKKNDSVPVYSENAEVVAYWTQAETDFIRLHVTVDRNVNGKMRIESVNMLAKFLAYDVEDSDDSKLDSARSLLVGRWIDSRFLLTDFDEWVYIIDYSDEDTINKPYLYTQSTISLQRQLINSNNWYLIEVDTSGVTKHTALYEITVLGCKGRWIEVEIKLEKQNLRGWMAWYNFCHHVFTNCHNLPEDGVENEE